MLGLHVLLFCLLSLNRFFFFNAEVCNKVAGRKHSLCLPVLFDTSLQDLKHL